MKKFIRSIFFAVSAFFFVPAFLSAADTQFTYSGSQNYSLVERTDLRRYDNGKYVGLMSREARSLIVCENGVYDGDFFVSQDTVHNQKIVANGLHDSIRAVFKNQRRRKNGNA